jgi:L-fuculose-phosphate aldolase
MNEELIQNLKKNITAIGRLLWEKDLVTGLNGNISVRLDAEVILLTAHNTCLGLLQDKDILSMKLDGQLLDEGSVSTEKLLHTEIYKNFPQTKALIHTHTTYANAYFLENETFVPKIFESKFYLGEVQSVNQMTPAVTDSGPVIDVLKSNNIVALRNHGVVAIGEELFDCFLLIQALEEAVKIDAISRLYKNEWIAKKREKTKIIKAKASAKTKKFKLFSKEQIDSIVKYVNEDSQMNDLGEKTKMTMDLAVKLDETGQIYSFRFVNGKITKVGHDGNVEFLINAPEDIWRAVFNREIDPFVATTQKKMHLRGDFAKISKWYAPCSRVFELWQRVPVE